MSDKCNTDQTLDYYGVFSGSRQPGNEGKWNGTPAFTGMTAVVTFARLLSLLIVAHKSEAPGISMNPVGSGCKFGDAFHQLGIHIKLFRKAQIF